MQRLSTSLLAFALTIFVAAISLALLTATWVMTTYLLNGFPPLSTYQWATNG